MKLQADKEKPLKKVVQKSLFCQTSASTLEKEKKNFNKKQKKCVKFL